MLESTNKFKLDRIVYNKGHFAIALGRWDGRKDLTAACRWHESDGIGYPQTFGKGQWMNLPDDIKLDIVDALNSDGAKVVITFT